MPQVSKAMGAPKKPTSSRRRAHSVASDGARALLRWFRRAARDLPWRRTLDPYAIWVSEIMLQQTQVKTVIPYYERWMSQLPDLEVLARTPIDEVLKLWQGLGYYSRARNLHLAAQAILANHEGQFPTNAEQILSLPGIGRYTAGAISSISFNEPQPILDGNVIRVMTRVHAIATDPKSRAAQAFLWKEAEAWVSAASRITPHHQAGLSGNCSALNQALMELGATICSPKAPQCHQCPLSSLCRAHQKGHELRYPKLPKRAASIARSVYAFVLQSGPRLWVGRRVGGGANSGLWELPTIETPSGSQAQPIPEEMFRLWSGVERTKVCPLIRVKHSITKHRFETSAFVVKIPTRSRRQIEMLATRLGWKEARWMDASDRSRSPFAGAHAKIVLAWESRAHA